MTAKPLTATARTVDRGVAIEITGDRPPTTNSERDGRLGGWRTQASTTRLWRRHACIALQQLHPRHRLTTPVRVDVTPLHATHASPQDAAACQPAAKAIIDGAVDAGLIPDDGPDHVTHVAFDAPTRGAGRNGITVVIRTADPKEVDTP